MKRRRIATLYLPMEVSDFAQITTEIATVFDTAVIARSDDPEIVHIDIAVEDDVEIGLGLDREGRVEL